MSVTFNIHSKFTLNMGKISKEQYPQFFKDAETMSNPQLVKKYGISLSWVKKLKHDKKNENATASENKTNHFLQEFSLKEVFDDPQMQAKINPKKEKEEEEENECGKCHGKFNGKPKLCPHCGVEFE